MKGLRRMIELCNGLQKSFGYCLNKVRRLVGWNRNLPDDVADVAL